MAELVNENRVVPIKSDLDFQKRTPSNLCAIAISLDCETCEICAKIVKNAKRLPQVKWGTDREYHNRFLFCFFHTGHPCSH